MLIHLGLKCQELELAIYSELIVFAYSVRLVIFAVQPPSMTRVVPVTHDDSSDARYSAAFAMSSGLPSLPREYLLTTVSVELWGMDLMRGSS